MTSPQEAPTDETKGTHPQAASTVPVKETPPALKGAPLLVAILAIVVWAVFVVFLSSRVSSEEVEWTRLAWVFASIEGVAFAAMGALWGTSVQRSQTEKAEQRAEVAEKQATDNKDLAVRGQALAAALQAEENVGRGELDEEEIRLLDSPDADLEASIIRRHASLARALFGE